MGTAPARLLTALLLVATCQLAAVRASHEQRDPYAVLGVGQRATGKDIKQAYKRLAMEWHPDKNQSPGAGEKFMLINQAYEILSDPAKKEQYDRYGTVTDAPHHPQQQSHEFDHLFNFAFGGGHSSAAFEKHRVTARMYAQSLLERSHRQPFILYAYSGYCQLCFLLESVWSDAVADLEALGYGVGTVNYVTDGNLFEKLRVNQIPSLVVLVEGRVVHYRGNMQTLSSKAVRLFARDAIPAAHVAKINSHTALRRFLDQWEPTNKPSVLMLAGAEEPRLRYLLAAMKYAEFARFAHIHLADADADVREMRKALGILCTDCEAVLVFKEAPEAGPVAKLIGGERRISSEQIAALLDKEKFLLLPRVSSPALFDERCPVSSRTHKHLCVLLPVAKSADAAERERLAQLRRFLQVHGERLAKERLTVSYVYAERQREFMRHFGEPQARALLVLWRYEYVKAKYAWLPLAVAAADGHFSFEHLQEQLYLAARGTVRLEGTAALVNLVDEYALSWFTRASRSIVRMIETVHFHITKEEALPILSVVGTLAFIICIGYVLNHLIAEHGGGTKRQQEKTPSPPAREQKEWHPEDPRVPKPKTSSGGGGGARQRIWHEMEPMIHELRAETYFGLIRLLKPGCRSIVVLVDTGTKDTLLPQFAKHLFPLRNNKTFSFGFLMVNKNLAWFRSLLEHTLPESEAKTPASGGGDKPAISKDRLKAINPKQTIGTVLVLCGWKLYFSVYHPMHSTARTYRKNYVGFECSDGEDAAAEEAEADEQHGHARHAQAHRERDLVKKELNVENVLNGLPSFVDRLLEGSIRRYYVPEWPDNLH